MVGLSLLTLFIYLALLLRYLLLSYTKIQELCIIVIPCLFLYSRYPEGYEIWYVSTILGFILIVFFAVMSKWMTFDKLMKISELREGSKGHIARMFCNSWDWSINNQYESSEMRRVNERELKLTIDEEKIK